MRNFAVDKYLFFEDSAGCNTLISIKTSKKTKKEMQEKLRTDLKNWLLNKNFKYYSDKLIDLSIVLYLNNFNYKKQDVDNIAKIVLDALSKNNKNDKNYIFNNDSQIVRLLVYKIQQTTIENVDTNQVIISFREHNPKKEMRLISSEVI